MSEVPFNPTYQPASGSRFPYERIVPNQNSGLGVDRTERGVDKAARLAKERREAFEEEQRRPGLEPDFPFRVIEFDPAFFKIPADPPPEL